MNKSIFNDGKYDDEMLHQLHGLQKDNILKWKEQQKKKHIFRFEKLN